MPPAPTPTRAGFTRRLAALVIDVIIVLTVVTLIGVTLSKLSGGFIRVQSTLIKSTDCKTLEAMPAGLELPQGFKPTSITACTYSFLSIPYNWTVKAEQITESDVSIGGTEFTTSKTLSYTYPLSPYGLPAEPVVIDEYSFLLYGLYFIALEWLLGGTLAQRMLGMRVRSVGGAPASLIQIVKRFVARFAWLALAPIGEKLLQSSPGHLVEIIVGLAVISMTVLLAVAVNAIWAMKKGELAWHDRWARTEVVRQNAISQLRTSAVTAAHISPRQ